MKQFMTPQAREEWRAHWKLVLASAVGASMATIAIGSLGVFITPLEKEFGWTRAEISAGFGMYAAVGIFFAPLLGGLLDRWGARWFAVVGVLYSGTAFALFGTATGSPAEWLFLWFLFSIGGLITKPLLWSTAIAKSFNAHRGVALGAMYVGASLGSIVTPILASALVEALGWRLAYGTMGFGWGGLACLVCYLFFYTPDDKPGALTEKAPIDWSEARNGLASSTFFKIAAGTLIATTFCMGLYIHLFPALNSVGFTRTQALLAVSLTNAGSLASKVIGGFFADRYPGNRVTAGVVLLPMLAYGALLLPLESVVVRLIAVGLMGISTGGVPIMLSYIASRYFGLKTYGTMFGFIFSSMAVSLGVGPILAGYVYDQTHSYDAFLASGLAGAVIAALLFLSLGRYPEDVKTH
jgi:MFS family permease